MSHVATYTNPLYPKSAANPFVFKFLNTYWCYSTGCSADKRCFPILKSTNLIDWKDCGAAMDPLSRDYPEYWSPEVNYWNGRFYMYYAVGDGLNMHIRVAIADHPSGPFSDTGSR